MQTDTIHNEDCLVGLSKLPDESVQCCVSSPPYYGLRDYGHVNQIGLEKTPEEYVNRMVQVFREVRRVLKNDGVLWLNLGDSYAGGKTGRADHGSNDPSVNLVGNSAGAIAPGPVRQRPVPVGFKPKDLIGIPWMVAFALRADGWYLRQDIIWHKPNPMPESVRDRCTKAHEYVFLLSKSPRYFFDADAIREDQTTKMTAKYYGSRGIHGYNAASGNHRDKSGSYGNGETRNKRSVWTITPKPYAGAHFATMPEKLVEPCILAGSREGDIILDPFMGAGTVAKVAQQLNRRYLGFELNAEYCQLAQNRLGAELPQLRLLEQTA